MQLNYFRWDKKEEAHDDYFRFCRLLIKFREYVFFFLPCFSYLNDMPFFHLKSSVSLLLLFDGGNINLNL